MTDALTLRQLLEQNPEWADLPIGIYRSDGELDIVGGAGSVYLQTYEDVDSGEIPKPTVVFSAN